jgi:hypothetical protein
LERGRSSSSSSVSRSRHSDNDGDAYKDVDLDLNLIYGDGLGDEPSSDEALSNGQIKCDWLKIEEPNT